MLGGNQGAFMADIDLLDDYREKLAAAREALTMFEARNMRFIAGGVDLTDEGKKAIRFAVAHLEEVVGRLEGRSTG
jgi:hypothetical protein